MEEACEAESLAEHAKRIAEELKADTAERRTRDPRFDAECRMLEVLEAHGFENVTSAPIALKPDVTFSADAMVVDLPGLAGYQLRVVSTTYSIVNAPYSGPFEDLTVRAVRQLMIAQREQAQKWLEAHPEETSRKGFEHL
jgi:hypothetical protein